MVRLGLHSFSKNERVRLRLIGFRRNDRGFVWVYGSLVEIRGFIRNEREFVWVNAGLVKMNLGSFGFMWV